MPVEKELKEVAALKAKGRILHDQAEIERGIDKMASEMKVELADKAPVFLCVLNGAMVFIGQLLTRLDFPLQVNYIHATRYQGEIEGSHLHWKAEPTIDLENRTVVIVEDILDTGLTLSAIVHFCQAKKAKKIYTATLIDKKRPREPGGVETCDFIGLEVENKFIYGYGLDYKDFLRNEPGIFAVEE
jgi:hypoxanthine phosphoribosyltransferase